MFEAILRNYNRNIFESWFHVSNVCFRVYGYKILFDKR